MYKLGAFFVSVKEAINSFEDIPQALRIEMFSTCLWWYGYCYHYRSLQNEKSSLENDLKSLYKRYRKDLEGFEEFFKQVYDAYKKYAFYELNH